MKKLFAIVLMLLVAMPAFAEDAKESTYDRVLRTKTIRCGYIPYAPAVMIDPNTKAFSGIIPEVMEEAARLLDLKIEWAEEVGWGTTVDSIRTGRVDAICVGFWENPAEGKYLFFSRPLYYSPMNAYVRVDDTRFDMDITLLDNESMTIVSGDGEMSGIIARQDFPKAKVLSLPNMGDTTEQLLAISTKKADASFFETWTAEDFIAKNPNTLKNVTRLAPMRVFADTIALPMDDVKFKAMLDNAFNQIINSGHMDKIIAKYEKYPGSLLRVAKPYEAPK
ncbi:MAG: ABC transporter substrate-binding protein [Alphaproteobacteria bacterium]|nr:ABC transporter substrate-binding protein [Alphaproteobacteria bacterium]